MIEKKYLPTRKSNSKCLILIGLMIGLYLIDNSSVASRVGSQLFIYYIKPALWMGLTLLVWWFPKTHPKGKLRLRGFVNLWTLNLGIIYIVVSILAGIIDGFGRSPYSHTSIGILMNIITVGSAIVGIEFIRSYLISNLTKEENYLVFVLIALLMTIVTISLNRFFNLKELKDVVKFIAQYFAPEFCKNLLATYLVFLGGPLPAIIYRAIVEGFHWLSPILPNLQWITKALIGILCPLFSLLAIQGIYGKEARKIKREDEEEGLLGWMITSLVSIGMIWFAVGVFPIYPSVVATGSMEPMIYPGDVILVEKITDIKDIHQLKVGDVIQFQRERILISHRIIEIKEDDEGILRYRTQGDNNSAPDTELVGPEDIRGTIKKVVPKVGWPTLLLKQKKDAPMDYIEF
ncbi:signal peptidase I [Natronincola ferrireducens]|uniref:Signal peptidase I n=1 Tax=Natronincola ferrireducens TaxID=393762 RepID=A0A1G8XVC3_9FIRM|nr:signal peptidase I [Natronincola ferrireducens]SDJ94582.1 signal peptidase, endoplasmic reticulum-type [Natronincola ferrireducens]